MSRQRSSLDPALVEQVRAMQQRGMSRRAACREVGIAESTMRAWEQQGPVESRPIPDNLPEDPTPQEIPVFVRDYTDRDEHYVYPIGDLHIGSPMHAGDLLDEWFAYLESRNDVSMLNTGDNTNCALSSSVSDEYGEKLTVKAARQEQAKLFAPLAAQDKIDVVVDGNHELRVYRATGDTPNSAVCDALGINYTMSSCIVRYLVGDQFYDLYLRHGTGGGGKMGAQVNRLGDQDGIIDADIYVSGHTHTQVAFVKDVFKVTPPVATLTGSPHPTVERKKRLYVCSGSFMGYEDYAAQAGYPPAHIGAPRVRLDGRRKDAHASV